MTMDTQPPQAESLRHDSCSTLPGLLRRIAMPVHPRLLAYLLGLLFVCLLGFYETHRADVTLDALSPLPLDSLIAPDREIPCPDPDGTRWIVYAQQAAATGHHRLQRWSMEDNWPTGRYVGWSTPPMLWLEGLGWVRHEISGEDMSRSIDEVSVHYNTILWILAAATMGWMCIGAYGWRGAFIIPCLYALLAISKYGVFSPDHHLWILLSALGTLVCLSAPFLHEGRGRVKLWFVGAALFSAFGLWISAPSEALVMIGIFVGLLFLPAGAARLVDSANWRLYGYLTAFLSLVFCWVEFHPEIPINVELNNPVYVAGALVAGLWMWQLHEFAASDRRWASLNARVLVYSALGLLIVVTPMIVYLSTCFSLADPYFARWEAQISEEAPIDILGYVQQNAFFFAAVIAAIFALVIRSGKMSAGSRAALALLAGLAVTWGYFGISSNRFSEVVLACLCVLVAMAVPTTKREYAGWVAVVFIALTGLAIVHRSGMTSQWVNLYGQPDDMAGIINVRIQSNKLLHLAEKGKAGGILAPSNEANSINFFTRMPVYGTAYWENRDGLLYTWRIFYYETPDGKTSDNWAEVRHLLKQGEVRYIVIPKDFGYQSSYMIYGKGRIMDPQYCFAYYLLHTDKDKFVPWLKLAIDDDKYRTFTVEGL